jgi:hypothetical protein
MPREGTDTWWLLKEPGWSDNWMKAWEDAELDETSRQRLLNRTDDGEPTVFFGQVRKRDSRGCHDVDVGLC